MNDFLFKLCGAIATAEGFFVVGSLPQRNNNPGDLRAAPWLKNPTIEHGFWKAGSVQEGIAGLYHQVALNVARGQSLRQMITAYAPSADGNDTENYIKETSRRVGIDPEVPMWNYLTLEKIT